MKLLTFHCERCAAYMTLQGIEGVYPDPRITFTLANVAPTGLASWPPCNIVNSTTDAIWERVKGTVA
jgi:hypothetical protein